MRAVSFEMWLLYQIAPGLAPAICVYGFHALHVFAVRDLHVLQSRVKLRLEWSPAAWRCGRMYCREADEAATVEITVVQKLERGSA